MLVKTSNILCSLFYEAQCSKTKAFTFMLLLRKDKKRGIVFVQYCLPFNKMLEAHWINNKRVQILTKKDIIWITKEGESTI